MDKLVYVKSLERPLDKFGKEYSKVTDQDNQTWAFFRDQKFEVGKAYLFTYENNEKGFPDVSKITPLVNIFVQQALKETAHKNDIIRNYTLCLSYAKDLVNGGKINLDEMEVFAMNMYNLTMRFADQEYNRIMNNPIDKI